MNATTVAFKTVGCRLNQAETARMRAAFESAGFSVTPFGAICDICIIHGCTVTAKAEKDSLRLARLIKRRFPSAFVILAGCVAEIGGEPLRKTAGADLLAGQTDKFILPALLARHGFQPAPPVKKSLPPRFDTTRAIVKIQDGCEFRCAYCIVPDARGRSRSRPAGEILVEINRLVHESGFREIVLTGANIGCYNDDGTSLADLLEQVETRTSVERIRLSSIELTTAERPVIEFMASSKKLCRFLHLPLQSGSDAVLSAMGRHYTTRGYLDTVAYALNKIGPLGLGADVLAGFPGEDAAAFAETERFIDRLPFSNLHIFAYSPRPGTPAAGMSGQVTASEKKRRVARLIALGKHKRAEFARQWIGRDVCILIESVDASGWGTGWTGEYLPARLRGHDLQANTIIGFKPEAARGDLLIGTAPFRTADE
ncbi:MAG: MiaB/RimO family radical SAM methylthiotransferase [Verrucomicrobia bacterium]|nr:MiaB/RimO family radical SAM methylthiotransferase [Verrucomicrobiota bacterium]MCG2679197.1 MiaB/RimO family radical SAM methylthiotransferase [Kiritimatiellia bacterium]MBU4248132.1 MiaB/RimO family radical SAM methylthiotransferase [Verrucomicrobiota bacterium]MBU4289509.1 MiaB/RimO family radical SAM methylthiotransferase [Verrucomicrobiota bacterium]MBU4430465.1 MiaB/RimO family radical SAM methylthiotransferase [Verrucomicrobiota bacterium]